MLTRRRQVSEKGAEQQSAMHTRLTAAARAHRTVRSCVLVASLHRDGRFLLDVITHAKCTLRGGKHGSGSCH